MRYSKKAGTDLADLCPACHQPLPVKGERACARCHGKIRRYDRWHAVGSLIFHWDCQDRTLSGCTVDAQQKLIDVNH